MGNTLIVRCLLNNDKKSSEKPKSIDEEKKSSEKPKINVKRYKYGSYYPNSSGGNSQFPTVIGTNYF